VRRVKVAGVCVSLLGLALLIVLYIIEAAVPDLKVFLSNGFFFLHALCQAGNVFIQRKLLIDHNFSPLRLVTTMIGVAMVLMIITFTIQSQAFETHTWQENFYALGNIIGVLYTVVIANVCTFAIMAWCIRRSSISIVSIYVSARPGFVILISALG
jgi:drug/metabolite transporter (DMT)-like permease